MKRSGLLLLLFLLALGCDSRSAPEQTPPSPAHAPTKAVASASATAAPAAPVVAERELSGIHYLLLHTGGAKESDTLPLIMAIHGLGDRPRRFVGVAASFQLPARVVVPRGLDPYGGGFSWFSIHGVEEAKIAEGVKHAADRLAALLAALTSKHPTRGKPIVTGFSQGGMLSFALAVAHPEQVGSAVPLAGWLPAGLWPKEAAKSSPPIVALHGDADNVLPIAPTRDAVAALRKAGFDVQLNEYPGVGHTLDAAMRRELFRQLAAAIQRGNAKP